MSEKGQVAESTSGTQEVLQGIVRQPESIPNPATMRNPSRQGSESTSKQPPPEGSGTLGV